MPTLQLTPVPDEGLEALATFIAPLWHDTYDALIGQPQVDYMLEHFQSPAALREQIAHKHYTYFYLADAESGEHLGYCGLATDPSRLFLSKLYLRAELRSKGLGQMALALIADVGRAQGLKAVYLTVNKGNARAVRAYEKAGFKCVDAVVSDIGGGFVMDDYIYELAL